MTFETSSGVLPSLSTTTNSTTVPKQGTFVPHDGPVYPRPSD